MNLQLSQQFGSDLDEATQNNFLEVSDLVELLKQGQYAPVDVVDQVISIFAGTKVLFDKVPVEKIRVVEADLLDHIKTRDSDVD